MKSLVNESRQPSYKGIKNCYIQAYFSKEQNIAIHRKLSRVNLRDYIQFQQSCPQHKRFFNPIRATGLFRIKCWNFMKYAFCPKYFQKIYLVAIETRNFRSHIGPKKSKSYDFFTYLKPFFVVFYMHFFILRTNTHKHSIMYRIYLQEIFFKTFFCQIYQEQHAKLHNFPGQEIYKDGCSRPWEAPGPACTGYRVNKQKILIFWFWFLYLYMYIVYEKRKKEYAWIQHKSHWESNWFQPVTKPIARWKRMSQILD